MICIPLLEAGGTEIQTLNTVQALVQGGHEVTVACYFEHTPDMVARYRKAGAEVILFSPEGVRVGGYKSILFLYRHLRRAVRAVRPDVVHVQYMAPGAMVILLLWLMGVKNIIATAHTAADIYRDLRLIHILQRRCLRAFTCITERAERSFFGTSQLYTPDMVLGRRNHFTIYNSLPAQMRCNVDANVDVDCHPDGNIQHSTFNIQHNHSKLAVIGVVSRLERIKGMDLVVPAFAEVLKHYPDTQLLVVGDGTLRGSMEEQAAQLGCADRVRFVGRQPQEELSQWYSQMDIVLMPSRSEGFGLTAIEAMAHGCVMVASDVGGLPEVVRDGVCGLLHRTEDIADMASKVCSLIGDEALYTQLRAQSLVEVEKYSFERYAALMNDLYNKLGR
jgi:glycosyltransferase involved in cell wall biosynthesis